MLLRASSEHDGNQVDLGNIFAEGIQASKVPHAALLLRFADAVIAEYDQEQSAGDELDIVRAAVASQLGQHALVDVAAVVAVFNAVVIVADATGIPLEPYKETLSADLRATLGLDAFRLS